MVRNKQNMTVLWLCFGIAVALLFGLSFMQSIHAHALDPSEKGDYGVEIDTMAAGELTDIKYIPNADYFKANPQHKNSKQTGYENGACTTIAMQMLLGYHNYYSDRRLIPEVNENGVRFLAENYGDLREHPIVQPQKTDKQGRASIDRKSVV